MKATVRRFESFPAFHTRRSFTTPLHKSHAATANGYLGAANYLECSRFDVECRPKRRYDACRAAFHSPDKSRREDFAPLETPPMNERILCFFHLAVAHEYPDTWRNPIKRSISLSHFRSLWKLYTQRRISGDLRDRTAFELETSHHALTCLLLFDRKLVLLLTYATVREYLDTRCSNPIERPATFITLSALGKSSCM